MPYNPNSISPLVSDEQRRQLLRRGVYRPSGEMINPETGEREWTAGGWRNPARIAFQQPESAGNVGPYYRERLEELEVGGGRAPRGATGLPATMPVTGQLMAESPAVQQWREAQRIKDEQARMAGQLQGGAYSVGTVAPYGAGTYQDRQIASLAAPGGALTPTRIGTPEGKTPNLSPVSPSLADTSFFPDQEIYTNPGAVDAGTLGAYQKRVNNFRRDFLQKAAMRKSNFSSVEEFKAFVENNPNYSPEIGTAAWDFAQSQLQRANPGLFQRITGQDKTREANNMSKLQWMEQALPNVAPDMTAEQKLRYINANPELLQTWQQSDAAKYRMNPATSQLEQIPITGEQKRLVEEQSLQKQAETSGGKLVTIRSKSGKLELQTAEEIQEQKQEKLEKRRERLSRMMEKSATNIALTKEQRELEKKKWQDKIDKIDTELVGETTETGQIAGEIVPTTNEPPVLTPEQASKLPIGTRFKTSNGRLMRRQ